MYERCIYGGQKKNLNDLAKIIGLPRKTLDDYYQLIQNATKRGFDFARFSR